MSHSTKSLISPHTAVLIVDDNRQFSALLQTILAQAIGLKEVTMVTSTDEAYRLIQREPNRFDLLFVDYFFPAGETGNQLLTRLRSNDLLDDKVAFLITSEPTIDNQREALSAGAQGVVAKPFDRHALRQQLEKAERARKADAGDSF